MKVVKHDFPNFRKAFKSHFIVINAFFNIAHFCHDTLKILQLNKKYIQRTSNIQFKKIMLITK